MGIKLFNRTQAAKRLGLTESEIDGLISKGEIPYIVLGRKRTIMFEKETIEGFFRLGFFPGKDKFVCSVCWRVLYQVRKKNSLLNFEHIEGLQWECLCFHIAGKLYPKVEFKKRLPNGKIPDIIARDYLQPFGNPPHSIIIEAKLSLARRYYTISKYFGDSDDLFIWCAKRRDSDSLLLKRLGKIKIYVLFSDELKEILNSLGFYDYDKFINRWARRNSF